jgi:L-asparaginase
MPPRILMVSLGGTITMTPAASGGLTPTLSADDLLRRTATSAAEAMVECWTPVTLPSASLTIPQIVSVAGEIRRRLADGLDAAIVVQGTDTLEETAFLLDCLIAGPQPVVVTGAMRGALAPGADGPANLEAAIRVALDPQSRDRGVLVVFGDAIHAARFARKVDTASLTAFRSPGRSAVGRLVEGAVEYHWCGERPSPLVVPEPCPERPVALVKFAMGLDDRLLRGLPALGFHGLVIEGAGGGHVSAAMMPAIRDLSALMPVVLASRCPSGPVFRSTYGYPGSEIDLLASGALHAGDLCGLKARLLLNLLLMSVAGRAEVEAGFRRRATSPASGPCHQETSL